MINQLQLMKERVYQANKRLPEEGLVKLTWGNVSEVDRDLGIIVIKPSGVDYQTMTVDSMVVCDLAGTPKEAKTLKPSSDIKTMRYCTSTSKVSRRSSIRIRQMR